MTFRAFFATVLLATALGAADAFAEELVVITHTPHGQMTQATVRAMFAMRLRQWSDNGAPVTVFVLRPSDPMHAVFCKRVLEIFPYQLQRVWDRLVYSGTGQAPIELTSMDEMKQRVSATVGAIGYITTDRLDERVYPLQVQ